MLPFPPPLVIEGPLGPSPQRVAHRREGMMGSADWPFGPSCCLGRNIAWAIDFSLERKQSQRLQ